MKRRILAIILGAVLLLALAACTQEPEVLEDIYEDIPYEPTLEEVEELEPEYDSYYEFEEEMTDADYHGLPDNYESPVITGTHNPEIVTAFTPEDAYVHMDTESFLVLTSEKSKTELIDFVLAAAEELGATLREIDEPWPDTWTYSGTLPNGNPLHIELRDDGGTGVNLMVLY
ncbi:MAG: hypothetical protein FWD05_01365 [Oscillospiraceae bacterium]|nr:hypothetical protein [Oscillospiraceae bacterium]